MLPVKKKESSITTRMADQVLSCNLFPTNEMDDFEREKLQDPLATKVWRMYTKAKDSLPNGSRLENLTWRMMAMTLKKNTKDDDDAPMDSEPEFKNNNSINIPQDEDSATYSNPSLLFNNNNNNNNNNLPATNMGSVSFEDMLTMYYNPNQSTSQQHQPQPQLPQLPPQPQSPVDDKKITQCSNCSTKTTPLWRRDPNGNSLCNACGLFLKLHGVVRPLSLKTDVIKKRNRTNNPKKETPTSLLPPNLIQQPIITTPTTTTISTNNHDNHNHHHHNNNTTPTIPNNIINNNKRQRLSMQPMQQQQQSNHHPFGTSLPNSNMFGTSLPNNNNNNAFGTSLPSNNVFGTSLPSNDAFGTSLPSTSTFGTSLPQNSSSFFNNTPPPPPPPPGLVHSSSNSSLSSLPQKEMYSILDNMGVQLNNIPPELLPLIANYQKQEQESGGVFINQNYFK